MALKELRAWFLNRVAGQEALFSKTRKNNKEGHRVFKDGDYPDEDVFRKLFQSTIFGLEPADRAKATGENFQTSFTGEQTVVGGHVTIATNAEAKSFSNGNEALYTRTVRPSQLPEIIEPLSESFQFSNLTYTGKVLDLENTATGSSPRNIYRMAIERKFANWLSSILTEATLDRAKIAPYPTESTPTGLDSLPAFPVGSVINAFILDSDLLNPSFYPKGRWLICDGKTLGNPLSTADIPSNEIKSLYVLLSRMDGRSEVQANADFDLGVEVALPSIDALDFSGKNCQYLIRY